MKQDATNIKGCLLLIALSCREQRTIVLAGGSWRTEITRGMGVGDMSPPIWNRYGIVGGAKQTVDQHISHSQQDMMKRRQDKREHFVASPAKDKDEMQWSSRSHSVVMDILFALYMLSWGRYLQVSVIQGRFCINHKLHFYGKIFLIR